MYIQVVARAERILDRTAHPLTAHERESSPSLEYYPSSHHLQQNPHQYHTSTPYHVSRRDRPTNPTPHHVSSHSHHQHQPQSTPISHPRVGDFSSSFNNSSSTSSTATSNNPSNPNMKSTATNRLFKELKSDPRLSSSQLSPTKKSSPTRGKNNPNVSRPSRDGYVSPYVSPSKAVLQASKALRPLQRPFDPTVETSLTSSEARQNLSILSSRSSAGTTGTGAGSGGLNNINNNSLNSRGSSPARRHGQNSGNLGRGLRVYIDDWEGSENLNLSSSASYRQQLANKAELSNVSHSHSHGRSLSPGRAGTVLLSSLLKNNFIL